MASGQGVAHMDCQRRSQLCPKFGPSYRWINVKFLILFTLLVLGLLHNVRCQCGPRRSNDEHPHQVSMPLHGVSSRVVVTLHELGCVIQLRLRTGLGMRPQQMRWAGIDTKSFVSKRSVKAGISPKFISLAIWSPASQREPCAIPPAYSQQADSDENTHSVQRPSPATSPSDPGSPAAIGYDVAPRRSESS